MDSNHRMTESESVALPLGEAPIKKALHWSAVHNVSEAQKDSIKRIIAQAGMKGKRQMRSCTPGTQGAAMSMDYPPIDEAAG